MPSHLPFKTIFSLRPLVDLWEQMAGGADSAQRAAARAIQAEFGDFEALKGQISVAAPPLPAHAVRLLASAVLPLADSELAVRGLSHPFSFEVAHATRSFHALCPRVESDALTHERTMQGYHFALRALYGVQIDFSPSLLYAITARDALDRYLMFDFDATYCTVTFDGPLPDLSPQVQDALMREPMNQALWEQHLPPERLTFTGFTIVRAVDVTRHYAFSQLCRLLLSSHALTDASRFDLLEHGFRILFGVPDLHIGFLLFERGSARHQHLATSWFGEDIARHTGTAIVGARPVGRSLLLDGEAMPALGGGGGSIYPRLLHAERCVNVDDLSKEGQALGYDARLLAAGYKSVVLAPLRHEGKLLGVLELASPTAGALRRINESSLEEVASLLTVVLKRTADEEEDRLQAVIKRAFTAIYPVVEWRFRQAARRAMERARTESPDHPDAVFASIEPILFRGVHGLYGLSDIRGSSEQRNAAIQQDLSEQLRNALGVASAAFDLLKLPAYDELRFQIERHLQDVADGLTAEEESRIHGYLQHEFEPTLDALAAQHRTIADAVRRYRTALDADLGIVYRARRTFETSVTRINEAVGALLDDEQEALQRLVPHYFEKFKTDGVEYTLYAGDSLVENGALPPLALRSLRVWQIVTACRIQHLIDRIRPTLPMPLELAHLILVQGSPLTIRFRTDERRFDVDGTYNVRYEIMKKRVEKAHVFGADGTAGGRLTQPGQIAIVYTTDEEAAEYREYLSYLSARRLIHDDVEALELEDLQGVKGLRALRARIAPASEVSESETGLRLVRSVSGAAVGQ